jgi:hypothetical protein
MLMKSRLILCAGLNRSGSTWQFNAVRHLFLAEDPARDIYSCWVEDYDPCHPAPIHIVKAHRPLETAALDPEMLVTTYRDLRAVAGSLIRMRWCDERRETIEAFLDRYVIDCQNWERVATLATRYDRILTEPAGVLAELALALRIDLNPQQIAEIEKNLAALQPQRDTPTGGITDFDPITLLHDGHIGTKSDMPARQLLSPSLIADIEIRYHDWLVTHGFSDMSSEFEGRAKTWQQKFSGLATTATPIPILTPNAVVSCADSDLPAGLLSFGFAPEGWGAWSIAPLCALQFGLPETCPNVEIVMHIGALTLPGSPPLIATAYLNGEKVNTWLWRDSTDGQDVRIPINSTMRTFTLCFAIEGARSARSLNVGDDERLLGLALKTLGAFPISVAA